MVVAAPAAAAARGAVPSAIEITGNEISWHLQQSAQWLYIFCFCIPSVFMGWGAVQGITNNLAGRPLGRGFVLWAVLCGHAPLPERFCVWAAFLRGCLADNSVVRPPPSLCLCFFFFQVFSSLFHFESPNFGRNR